jgi:S1-C subfamily serine protease
MMRKSLEFAFAVIVGLALPSAAHAQDVPMTNSLFQVFEIRHGNDTASCFAILDNNKQYLVTARHAVTGLPTVNAELEINKDGYWDKLRANILFPKNAEVDIAVLQISKEIVPPLELTPESKGAFLGQQVYFLGFPYELHSLIGTHRAPFVKSGTLSGNDSSDSTAVIWYIDGFNNPGFSGGPVIFWDRVERKWKVLGVTQGYRQEPAHVRVGGKNIDTQILVNSGILIAYDIRHALEAIDEK